MVYTARDLLLFLNTELTVDSNVACTTKRTWNAFLPKAILHGPNPHYFPSLVQSVYSPASWICNTSILPLSLPGLPALESVQKLAVKFVRGLRHVPYDAQLRRKIGGDLKCICKIMHGLLELGLRGRVFKIYQQRSNTRRSQHAEVNCQKGLGAGPFP